MCAAFVKSEGLYVPSTFVGYFEFVGFFLVFLFRLDTLDSELEQSAMGLLTTFIYSQLLITVIHFF